MLPAAFLTLLVAIGNFEATLGFQVLTPKVSTHLSTNVQTRNRSALRQPSPLHVANDKNDELSAALGEDGVENMDLWGTTPRSIIAGLSTIGAVETGYLTYVKVFVPDGIKNICGGASSSAVSSCSSVLNSPYANVQLGENVVPLTVFGFVAYTSVAILSILPMLTGELESRNESDENNRIAILGITTAMATFSSFLLSLLFNILHQSCPYCYLSAALSISMGFLAWFSGALPMTRRQDGVKLGVGSFLTTTVASLALFLSVDEVAMQTYTRNQLMQANGLASSVDATNEPKTNIPPPPITATSSDRALKIGEDLKSLDAKMFGAYWCTHCYDQKQRLGKEAFANVEYNECAKEGLNSKADMCKEKKVPGYPTWEINGNLYPGGMYLDELEDIIQNEKQSNLN
jgi:uncharacterized membrane protein